MSNVRIKNISLYLMLFVVFFCTNQTAQASFLEKFTDPTDGKFDTSEWLLTRKGFLPVPILVTEPAVGYGLGAALVFFHKDKDNDAKTGPRQIEASKSEKWVPPSVTVGFGAYTENDTWFAGGAHMGVWKNDNIRYIGALVRPSLNLNFYGDTGGKPSNSDGWKFNLDAWLLLQEVVFRFKDSDWFAGGRFIYMDTKSTFDFNSQIVDDWQLDYDSAGLGLVVKYDSRDNTFTPNKGLAATLSSMWYKETGGSEETDGYNTIRANSLKYWQLSKPLVLGWRLEGGFANGDVPFFALPFINIRGIPALRYQGEDVVTTEVEARWQATPRWGLIGFTGVGRAADSVSDLSSAESRWAGGAGIRYLIARKLGLHVGVDVARGPEEWAFYLQMGSAWVY